MPNKLTLKQKAFIKETARTLNPTDAVRKVYQLGKNGGSKKKELKNNTANSIAYENLRKPDIQRGFKELLKNKLDDNERTRLLTRNAKQDKNLPASNQALDMSIKITGDYEPEKKITLNITPDNVNKLIEAKFNELKQLRAEGQTTN